MKKQTKKVKINVLYFLAIQLLGFGAVLYSESDSVFPIHPEINIVIEKATPSAPEFAYNQLCTEAGCKTFGP